MALEDVPRCQHLKMNGTQCGSPALRRKRHCFFHERIRREQARIKADATAQRHFDLPLLEDANSVQVALMKVIQMLGSGRLEHKTAGLMLYALQTASSNLRKASFEVDEVTEVVIDRDDIDRTSIGGPQWFEEDFETEEDAEEEEEADEAEAKQVKMQAAKEEEIRVANEKAKEKERDESELNDVRKGVQAMARNWVLEAARGKSAEG